MLRIGDGYGSTRLLQTELIPGPLGDEHSFVTTSGFTDGMTDAFGRLRVSNPSTEFALKQLYDGNPLFYDDQEVSGSGTASTYNTNQSSTTLSVGNLTAGHRVKQSKMRGVYQPAKSFRMFGTFNKFHTVAGITKRVGYFDSQDGLFLESKDGVVRFVVRSYTSGAVVDTPYDLVIPFGVTPDWSKFQILDIDFEWLGGGLVRCALNLAGKVVYLRKVEHANVVTEVYMRNPNLPIRYEIINDGTGPAHEFTVICASLMSEGGTDDVAQSTHVSRRNSPITLGAAGDYVPVISIRINPARPWTRLNPLGVTTFLTSNTNYEWILLLNPTIAGVDAASWTSVPNSSIQFDVSRTNANLVTGGYPVDGDYNASTNQSRSPSTASVKTFLSLGASIDGTPDEFVLAIAPIGGSGGTAYGGITVGEYY